MFLTSEPVVSPARRRARPWGRAFKWLLLLVPFFYATYGLANYVASVRDSVDFVVFAWEEDIPFWPWTIYPYWSINLFYGLSLFLAPSRHVLDRHALRLLTAQVIAVTCFLIWPLAFTFGQPQVTGAPGVLFEALRGFDKPFNQAPSLHIALAVVLWDLYRRIVPSWMRFVVHVWTAAICLSVLTTYQHHFLDIPTGALLGVICVWLWPLETRVAVFHSCRLRVDMRRWVIAGLYASAALILAVLASMAHARGSSAWLWLWWPACSLLMVAAIYLLVGERGFQTNRDGRMHWSARWLLAFYRAGARLNVLVWTLGKPSAQQVLPGLWLGRLPSNREWQDQGRRVLVSFCPELQAPVHAQVYCLPILDMTVPPVDRIARASAVIDRAFAQAKKRNIDLQICCALGYSRSSAALICWLVRSGCFDSVDAALQKVRTARPDIVLGPLWLNAIERATHPGEFPK